MPILQQRRFAQIRAQQFGHTTVASQEAIIDQTLNSSGVRDIGRNLKINKNTVVAVLKKTLKTNPYFGQRSDKLEVTVKLSGEQGEFGSFVQNKNNQRWTKYINRSKSYFQPLSKAVQSIFRLDLFAIICVF